MQSAPEPPLEILSNDPQVKSLPPPPFRRISITFDMIRLRRIPLPPARNSPSRVLVSMNPIHEPRSDLQFGKFVYHHPLFSSDSVSALNQLRIINGVQGVSFAGGWTGYGFPEDGFRAGMAAARRLLRGERGCRKAKESCEVEVGRQEKYKTDTYDESWKVMARLGRATFAVVRAMFGFPSSF